MTGMATWLVLLAVAAGQEPVGPKWPPASEPPGYPDDEAIPASATPSHPSTATAPTARANLLAADGSFELGDPDWCRSGTTADPLRTPLTIDRTCADHGRASARWLIEPEQGSASVRIPLSLTSPCPAGPYCVSVALRASSPQTLMAAASTGSSASLTRWQVGRRWQRFHQVFSLPSAEGSAPPSLLLATVQSPRPWVLWIDSLKVEAGTSPTGYRPAVVPLIGVSFSRRCLLFFEGRALRIAAGALCPRSYLPGARLQWTLTDGRTFSERRSLPLAALITRDLPIRAEPLARGAYRLDVGLVDRAGKPLARRSETFGVVREVPQRGDGGFRLVVPSRGPRCDAIARQIGLTVETPTTTSPRSRPASRTSTTRQVRLLPSTGPLTDVSERIGALTLAHAADQRTVHWPTAWAELMDGGACWRPMAVAVSTWLEFLAHASHVRRIRLGDGAVVLDVFSSPDRHVAIVAATSSTSSRPSSRRAPIPLEIPLPPKALTAYDLYGARYPTTDDGNRLIVDLSGEAFYLVAGTSLTRGRFALQLGDAQLRAPTSASKPHRPGP